MINVELSPATYLGVVLIGSGITLLQIRNQKPLLSRDTDIIAACIAILAGGILIFQVGCAWENILKNCWWGQGHVPKACTAP